jgi:hypothetical protein
MDRETGNILKVVAVAIVILWLFKRKKNKSIVESDDNSGANAVAPPKTSQSSEDVEYDNAVISITAFRNAINSGEPQSELNKLNEITMKDYGIKVSKCKNSGKLTARNKKGNDVAKEQ